MVLYQEPLQEVQAYFDCSCECITHAQMTRSFVQRLFACF